MPTRLPDATINLMLDNGIGIPANAGKLRVYSGVQPSAGAAITTQVKLLEYTMNVDAFPAAATRTILANAIAPATVLATGTATWYRLVTSTGTSIIDGDVGLANPVTPPDVVLDAVALVAGQVVSVISVRYTMPASA